MIPEKKVEFYIELSGGQTLRKSLTKSEWQSIRSGQKRDVLLSDGTWLKCGALVPTGVSAIHMVEPLGKDPYRVTTQPAESIEKNNNTPPQPPSPAKSEKVCPSCQEKNKVEMRRWPVKGGEEYWYQDQCTWCGWRSQRISNKDSLERVGGDESKFESLPIVEDKEIILNRNNLI